MPIAVKCQVCGATHQVSEQLAGQKVKCRCGGVISIPTADQFPTPQQQALPANSAFAGVADDEMDDLFGPVAGQSPQPDFAASEPDKAAPPPNLAGAEGAAKKETVDPNLPTSEERGRAIWSIVASGLAIPYGLLAAAVFGYLIFAVVIPMLRVAGASVTLGLAILLIGLLGAVGMVGAGLSIIVTCMGELKGKFPKSDQVFQLGTFASVGVLCVTTMACFGAPVQSFSESYYATKESLTAGKTFKEVQEIKVDMGPLVAQFMVALVFTAIGALLNAIVPGMFLHACRTHKFRRFDKDKKF